MGNNNSTTAQAVSPSNTITTTNSRRSQNDSSTNLKLNESISGKVKSTRRKKSIELTDVDNSLSFTSPSTGGNSVGGSGGGGGGGGRGGPHIRRKNTNTISNNLVVDNSGSGSGEDEMEPDAGTLRGALQGRADHVVYGPRRDDTAVANILTGGGIITTSTTNSSSNSTRPLNVIRRMSELNVIDPDDTTHPDYKASPRLTSAVLLSQDKMPVLVSPNREEFPLNSPFGASNKVLLTGPTATTSLAGISNSILAHSQLPNQIPSKDLLPPHTSAPYPPSLPPTNSVLAPIIPLNSLPLSADQIPSGTGVIPSPPYTPLPLSSPSFLLPPSLFNSPVAAIPIPLLSVPSATIAASLLAAAVDLGAGSDGVPTLIKWKDEDGQIEGNASNGGKAKGPKEVFVTGTFSNGWKTKIELRKNDAADFSALISLPPGPHRLKFIVDKEWKASKHLPVATDADGNLINYLHVNAGGNKATANILDWNSNSSPSGTPNSKSGNNSNKLSTGGINSAGNNAGGIGNSPWNILEDVAISEELAGGTENWDKEEISSNWTSEIPKELVEWGEWEAERDALEMSSNPNSSTPPPPPSSSGVPPPTLPAQLEKGPLNHAAYVTQGSGDDNSILPKPDHSVINHLAASPIKGGFLSVGVTTRYKRKFVTIVYYKALAPREQI